MSRSRLHVAESVQRSDVIESLSGFIAPRSTLLGDLRVDASFVWSRVLSGGLTIAKFGTNCWMKMQSQKKERSYVSDADRLRLQMASIGYEATYGCIDLMAGLI